MVEKRMQDTIRGEEKQFVQNTRKILRNLIYSDELSAIEQYLRKKD